MDCSYTFEDNKKISFIIEQLSLVFKKPTRRRYSQPFLAWAALIERISPACYEQMFKDAYMTLPTADYLRRITSAIDMDIMALTESALAYLRARFSKLSEKDRLVTLLKANLLDEVYTQMSCGYVRGNFFGEENGEATKTLLTVMIKSIAGKYRDIVSMTPVTCMSVELIEKVWKNVIEQVSKIGFDIAVTMTGVKNF